MVSLGIFLLAFAHDARGSRHSALTGSEYGPGQKQFGVLENRLGKQRSETYNDIQQLDRQCGHSRRPLLVKWSRLTWPVVIFSKIENG